MHVYKFSGGFNVLVGAGKLFALVAKVQNRRIWRDGKGSFLDVPFPPTEQ